MTARKSATCWDCARPLRVGDRALGALRDHRICDGTGAERAGASATTCSLGAAGIASAADDSLRSGSSARVARPDATRGTVGRARGRRPSRLSVLAQRSSSTADRRSRRCSYEPDRVKANAVGAKQDTVHRAVRPDGAHELPQLRRGQDGCRVPGRREPSRVGRCQQCGEVKPLGCLASGSRRCSALCTGPGGLPSARSLSGAAHRPIPARAAEARERLPQDRRGLWILLPRAAC
jgi:hypothetical protein